MLITAKKQSSSLTLQGFIAWIMLMTLASGLSAQEVWTPIVKGGLYLEPKAVLLEESSRGLLVKWELNGFYSESINTPQGEFTRLRISEPPEISASSAGSPKLPMLTAMIRVPEGYLAQAQMEKVEWVSAGRVRVYPRQFPTRDGDGDEPDFAFDHQVYLLTDFIPQNFAQAGSPQGWGGLPVTGVSATPFRYIPATGDLEIAHSIEVRVEFRPGGNVHPVKSHYPNPKLEGLQRLHLLNPPPLENRPMEADENDPVRMLVILREEALDIMAPLIQFHHNTGIRTETWIVDLNGVEDPQTMVKDRITDMFAEGLQYVLLVGDGYINNWHIPMFYWDPIDPPIRQDDTGTNSDKWYVCLDEPDQDGFDDHLPELAIGRLVYRRAHLEELAVQVDKILDYMNWSYEEPQEDWLGNCVLVADNTPVDNEPLFILCKQAIAGFDYTFPAPEFNEIYGNVQGNNNQMVINLSNGDGVGLFNYRGHGTWNETDHWNIAGDRINAAFVRRLANQNSPFILISSACLTADIATHLNNCLMETF
ncbi:MAG: C25 family cysteine peptidase, partial [Calditrichota bacterium]